MTCLKLKVLRIDFLKAVSILLLRKLCLCSGDSEDCNGLSTTMDHYNELSIDSPKTPMDSPLSPQLPPRPASAGSQKSPRTRRQRTLSQSTAAKAAVSTTSQVVNFLPQIFSNNI